MACKNCESERIASVSGKCSDMCSITLGESERNDYVPKDMGIGGGDYLEFSYCLDCGQIQGEFPLDPSEMESDEEEEKDEEEE